MPFLELPDFRGILLRVREQYGTDRLPVAVISSTQLFSRRDGLPAIRPVVRKTKQNHSTVNKRLYCSRRFGSVVSN